MKNLKDMTRAEMAGFFKAEGEKSFRAVQVFRWIYRGAGDFSAMTDLSKDLRKKLADIAYIGSLQTAAVQNSAEDGTRKFLFELADGNMIESVFMKYRYGNSICISSQAGCRMGCVFCASTRNGLERNLTAGEMADQIVCAQACTGERIGHVVVMGTGEPFENYEQLCRFMEIVNDREGLGIGMRNITVSTCGLVPFIHRFGDDFPQANLAVSLHGAQDDVRSRLMPVNEKYGVDELLAACREYTEKTRRRITFEYALIRGVNDSEDDMKALAARLKGMLCHVNLIPLNTVEGTPLTGAGRQAAEAMASFLENSGIPATVRRELGSDIDAACGQLRLKKSGGKST